MMIEARILLLVEGVSPIEADYRIKAAVVHSTTVVHTDGA